MTSLRMLVAYDGTDFSGFQIQPEARTVQGVLEAALARLASKPVILRAAGRTDAGVHALGQVVSVDETYLGSARGGSAGADLVMRAMPSLLPNDVAVLDVQSGPDGFDARHSARRREYVYLLWSSESAHPLYRKYALWTRDAIDVNRLSQALQLVVGKHDFTSFARVREDQSPVRTVLGANAVADGPFVRVNVTGESFLHQMVRSIVGTGLEVAVGRRPVSWMGEVLAARERAAAGQVAPAHGLTLVDVGYDNVSWPRRPAVTWPWSDLAYADGKRGCA